MLAYVSSVFSTLQHLVWLICFTLLHLITSCSTLNLTLPTSPLYTIADQQIAPGSVGCNSTIVTSTAQPSSLYVPLGIPLAIWKCSHQIRSVFPALASKQIPTTANLYIVIQYSTLLSLPALCCYIYQCFDRLLHNYFSTIAFCNVQTCVTLDWPMWLLGSTLNLSCPMTPVRACRMHGFNLSIFMLANFSQTRDALFESCFPSLLYCLQSFTCMIYLEFKLIQRQINRCDFLLIPPTLLPTTDFFFIIFYQLVI